MRQNNTIHTFFNKYIFFSSIGQDNSKLQKQISKLLYLNCTGSLIGKMKEKKREKERKKEKKKE